ncbi:MAG: MarR family transcriptional regulator [Erysipelotrichaceae bacterium]|jgi:DNA-binding MarR family transcriptional regulator|nr:MarR family transcriptional regulator [Erysipelotrichaceae bacterium]
MNRREKEELLFGSILLLSNKLQIWGDKTLESLSLKQWFLLMQIHSMEVENPTVNEIADFVGTSRQNVRKLLDHLQEQGFIEIKASKQDRRALEVSLSADTLEYLNENPDSGYTLIKLLFADLNDTELDGTTVTIFKIMNRLRKLVEKKNK